MFFLNNSKSLLKNFLLILLVIITIISAKKLYKIYLKEKNFNKELIERLKHQEEMANSLNQQVDFYLSGLNNYQNWVKEIATKIDFAKAIDLKNLNQQNEQEKIRFCIVVPSYNNENFVEDNLNSVLAQDYKNWHLVYFDDGSTDNTADVVNKIITKYSLNASKLTYVKYQTRKRSALYSFYNAAHNYCADHEVMVNLDGDDLLAHPNVLSKLAETYLKDDVWIASSSFIDMNSGGIVRCNKKIHEDNWQNIRKQSWSFSHLRSYYTWLFKKIDISYLKIDGEFIPVSPDLASMFSMLEMAGSKRTQCILDILYIYRIHGQNVGTIYKDEVKKYEKIIRDMQPYSVLK